MQCLLRHFVIFILAMNLFVMTSAFFDPFIKPTKFRLDKSGKLVNGQYGCTDKGGKSDIAPECASGFCCKWDKYPYGTCRSKNEGCKTQRLALADDNYFDHTKVSDYVATMTAAPFLTCIPNGYYGCQHDKREQEYGCCSKFCCQWDPYRYGTCQDRRTGCGKETLAVPMVY